MKKASLVVHKAYGNNEIFNPKSPLNRDNCLAFFRELRSELSIRGYDLQTSDLCSPDNADLVIYNEMPSNQDLVKKEKSVVLLFESELIRPDNWDLKKHSYFKYIFTWNDDFVDGKKYFKFNFTDSNEIKFKSFNEKVKFCTLVAGNKTSSHPKELYSKRVEVIRWFEKFHPSEFEFYGMGWDRYTFQLPLISRLLNRITVLTKMLAPKWPSYKGKIENKSDLLQNFKFSICYENAFGISGYITEKIFDSMAAGCVPVYWGAPNITEFIPADCFIHKPEFETYEDLYQYLSSIDEARYSRYQNSMKKFLLSNAHSLFESKFNAIQISEVVCRHSE